MAIKTLRIATRKSPLALWQAEFVRDRLQTLHAGLKVSLVPMSTRGDKIQDTPLSKVGGKALFVKELEQALLANEADIAVHSTKDVPVDLPSGLELPVILERHDPRDALVSNQYKNLKELPDGARVGTSSVRRQCQLLKLRPDLDIRDLRGNVGTRLSKLDANEYDAILLACAGLDRMGMEQRIAERLSPDVLVPAIAQGAMSIECRENDEQVYGLIALLNDVTTQHCILAERAMNRRLMGGCQVPIAGYAQSNDGRLHLRGMVGQPDGSQQVYGDCSGTVTQAEQLGGQLAEDLLARGADKILAEYFDAN